MRSQPGSRAPTRPPALGADRDLPDAAGLDPGADQHRAGGERSATVPVHDLGSDGDTGQSGRGGHRCGRGRHQVQRRTPPVSSPGCGSTRAPATPARTSGTSGRPPGRTWPPSPSPGRAPAAGSRPTSRRRWPSRPTPPTSSRTTPRSAGTPPTPTPSPARASTTRRCTRWPTASTARTGSIGTAPAAASPPTPISRRTTGSTSCSTPR